MGSNTGARAAYRASCTACHTAALISAMPASMRTFLAVAHLVLRTFIAARITYLCAKPAHRSSEVAAPRQIARRKAAGLRAIHVERNTARHHLDLRFLQT